MKSKILLSLIAIFFTFKVNAQWTDHMNENTTVVNTFTSPYKPVIMSTGKVYIPFLENARANHTADSSKNYILRLQILDTNGVTMFGDTGIVISRTINMSTYTVREYCSIDKNDNLYIGSSATGDGIFHLFKVDPNGNVLWKNDSVATYGLQGKILPLLNGDVIVASTSDSYLMSIERLNGQTGAKVWASPIKIKSETPANFYELSNGDFILVSSYILGSVKSTFFARRYDINGVAKWANAVPMSNLAQSAWFLEYSGVMYKDVLYYSYFGVNPVNHFDSYVQKLTPDGQTPWSIDGADFDTTRENSQVMERDIKIALDTNSGALYAVGIKTNPGTSGAIKGLYVQKYDTATGTLLFGVHGKEVFAPAAVEHIIVGDMYVDNGQPNFLAQEGSEIGPSDILRVVYLDSNGNTTLPNKGIQIASYAGKKNTINYLKLMNNQHIITFSEDRGYNGTMGNEYRIYAQNYIHGVTTSVKDIQQKNVVIRYNNPVDETLNINSVSNIQSIRIYNIAGQEILNKNFSNQLNVTLSTQNWIPGIYFATISTKEGTAKTIKIIKK